MPVSFEKIFANIFEVPWDFIGVGMGSIFAPSHGRISPMGDFIHLWYEVICNGSRFSGLLFGYHCHLQPYVLCK